MTMANFFPAKNVTRKLSVLLILCCVLLVLLVRQIQRNVPVGEFRRVSKIYQKIESENHIPKSNLAEGGGPPLDNRSYNFGKDSDILVKLIINMQVNKTQFDFLLNLRKLTLFGAHELDKHEIEKYGCNNENGKSCQGRGQRLWTNPLKIILLRTFTFPEYREHDVIFPVEPISIPYYVRIRQYHVSSENILKIDFHELEIKGDFFVVEGDWIKPTLAPSSHSYAPEELESNSWRLNESYFASDYIKYGDLNAFKILPQSRFPYRPKSNTFCLPIVKLLVIVASEPVNYNNRNAIRKSWASPEYLRGKDVRVVFMLGSFANKTLQRIIELEADSYEDIIQVKIDYSYHNQTLRFLAMLNWVETICGNANGGKSGHILKTDDNIFININLALKVAQENPNTELIGKLKCGAYPIRDKSYLSTWYTPNYMYIPGIYPGYLSGKDTPILLRNDVIPKLLKMSLTTPLIHMDAIYVTGLLARQLNIVPKEAHVFSSRLCDYDSCLRNSVNCHFPEEANLPLLMRSTWVDYKTPPPNNCNMSDSKVKIIEQSSPICLFE